MNTEVREEIVVIPTYDVGPKEKNPMFLEKRVYQGSSGSVYPYPVIESVSRDKEDKEWKALILENDYLKIMILPELGGRVQMAYDKTNNKHFVYYNQVIKPALVGLTGPWISGGIEFNWPQHHRPGTYDPTDYKIAQNDDGSATIWIGELERITRTRVTTAFSLRPGKAVLEIEARLYNGSSSPKSFLWWANPAVSVGDDYQSIFPPDVHAVMDHGKRDVSTFPIATGTYYKVDYSEGVDISLYKNIPVPTSYMAYHSDYDFMGCYDHGTKAGMLHIANHHLVPGKKQWTWGNGDFGKAWDRNLTDEDGPYIELMTGAFTDNQPDFSWLQPGEEKVFRQNFLPYKDLSSVSNASTEAALSLEMNESEIEIGAYVTAVREQLTLELYCGNTLLWSQEMKMDPRAAFNMKTVRPKSTRESDFILILKSGDEELLKAWKDVTQSIEIPEPANDPGRPEEIVSLEELYLTGLHLEQYRHATRNPEDYYKEGLKRDPGESRILTAMGKRSLEKADFPAAEALFTKAIKRLTARNPNPYDGEALFHLGWALRFQGKDEAAYEKLYKATWNGAWQGAAYTELARISCSRGNWDQSILEVDRALAAGAHNRKALHLKAIILRRAGRTNEAALQLEKLLDIDPLDHAAWYENCLLEREDSEEQFKTIIRDNPQTWLELSLDYIHCGQYDQAIELLQNLDPETSGSYPLIRYYIAYCYKRTGQNNKTLYWLDSARKASPDYCFPNRCETVMILEELKKDAPSDGYIPYYLGNFFFFKRSYDKAIAYWKEGAEKLPDFPTVRRNLALAAYNKEGNPVVAGNLLESAFYLDTSDARIMFELDQYYRKEGKSIAFRLDFLNQYSENVQNRDDLTIEKITLLNLSGQHDEALKLLNSRQFQPWEGGEGKVSSQYVRALIYKGLEKMDVSLPVEAEKIFQQARKYPDNLGEGKLDTITENELDFFQGEALLAQGKSEEAEEYYRDATAGEQIPASAMYYNDQSAELIYYQGLSWIRLKEKDKGKERFNALIDWAEVHQNDEPVIDYFAVSLPDLLIFEEDLTLGNKTYCTYLKALGLYGLGQKKEALDELTRVLEVNPVYPGASFLKKLWESKTALLLSL
jgi:tetratricopeptide (TPR) repeat protein